MLPGKSLEESLRLRALESLGILGDVPRAPDWQPLRPAAATRAFGTRVSDTSKIITSNIPGAAEPPLALVVAKQDSEKESHSK